MFCGGMLYAGSKQFLLQLVTREIPFPDYTDGNAATMVSRGKRPRKPSSFVAPGMTTAVWKIAEKCWHQEAKERLEVNAVLQCLESLANVRMSNSGVCAREECSFLESGVIDLRTSQMEGVLESRFSNGGERFLTAKKYN